MENARQNRRSGDVKRYGKESVVPFRGFRFNEGGLLGQLVTCDKEGQAR